MPDPNGPGPNPNYPNGYPPPASGAGNYPPPGGYPNYPPTGGPGNYPPPASYPPPTGTGNYPPPSGTGNYPPPASPTGSYPPPAQPYYGQTGQYPGSYAPPPGNYAPPPKRRGGLYAAIGLGLAIVVAAIVLVVVIVVKPGANSTAPTAIVENVATSSPLTSTPATTEPVTTLAVLPTIVPTETTLAASAGATTAPVATSVEPTATLAKPTTTSVPPTIAASTSTTKVASTATVSAAPTSIDFLQNYPGAKAVTVSQPIKDLFAQTFGNSAGQNVSDVKVEFYTTADNQAKIFKNLQDTAKTKGLVTQIQTQDNTQTLLIADAATKVFGGVVIIPADQAALLLGDAAGNGTAFVVITGKFTT